ncbi:hypothetical protein N9L19_00245 [bacterium]|nr:hypothetical protein [bacterium]
MIHERFFDVGSFPPIKQVKTAVAQSTNPLEESVAFFAGKTVPTTALSTIAYGQRLASWLHTLQQDEEAPTAEQLAVRIFCIRGTLINIVSG